MLQRRARGVALWTLLWALVAGVALAVATSEAGAQSCPDGQRYDYWKKTCVNRSNGQPAPAATPRPATTPQPRTAPTSCPAGQRVDYYKKKCVDDGSVPEDNQPAPTGSNPTPVRGNKCDDHVVTKRVGEGNYRLHLKSSTEFCYSGGLIVKKPVVKTTCKTDLKDQFPNQCKTAYFHNGDVNELHEVEITSHGIRSFGWRNGSRIHVDKTTYTLVLIKKIRFNPACDSVPDTDLPIGVDQRTPNAREACRAALTHHSTTVTHVSFYKWQRGSGQKHPD